MLNVCIHEGRFTDDPQVKQAGQTTVLNFTLGCESDTFDKTTGKKKPVFINFVAWGKMADNIAKFHKKGDVIKIESAEEDASYFDKNTNKKVYKNIKKVKAFHFAAGNNNNGNQAQQNNGGYQQQGYDNSGYDNSSRDFNPYDYNNQR